MIMATDSRCNLHKSILVILLWLCSSRQLQSNEAPKYAYNSTMLNVKGNFTNKTNYCNCTNDTSSQPEQQVRIKRHIFCDTKINTMNRVERRHTLSLAVLASSFSFQTHVMMRSSFAANILFIMM